MVNQVKHVKYPKRRKSPIRHRVKAHVREGRSVKSFERGKGVRRQTLSRPRKVVRVEHTSVLGVSKKTIEKVLTEWNKTDPLSKAGAQALSGYPKKEKEIVGVWRKNRQKRLDVLAEKCGGVRNLTLHYVHRPKRPFLYWFDKKCLEALVKVK